MRFVMDKRALGYVSSEYFGFPCQFSRIIGDGTVGQSVADVTSRSSLIQAHETETKLA
jgi:hypothetical protein